MDCERDWGSVAWREMRGRVVRRVRYFVVVGSSMLGGEVVLK